jgi:hypothetical protein
MIPLSSALKLQIQGYDAYIQSAETIHSELTPSFQLFTQTLEYLNKAKKLILDFPSKIFEFKVMHVSAFTLDTHSFLLLLIVEEESSNYADMDGFGVNLHSNLLLAYFHSREIHNHCDVYSCIARC